MSEWNGDIDWNAVKNSGIHFAMIRCGYRGYGTGKIVRDAKFDRNIQGALNAGIKVGLYFFTQATNEWEAVEEANYVLSLARNYNITYPLAIDTEISNKNANGRADYLDVTTRTNVMIGFCNTIRSAGYTPMVYASRNWFYERLDAPRLFQFDTWLAHYTGSEHIQSNYIYNYKIWQYSDFGTVNGINGLVDLNISYMNY